MAERDNILLKLHDLLVYLLPQLNKFPRDQKFVLGDRIETKVLDVQESCLRAYYSRDKRGHLLEANLQLEVTRHLVRLAHGLKLFSTHTYGVLAGKLDEVGRMIGGWLKQYWLSVCEGDSEGGGRKRLSASSGRSAPVHGLPQCPERKSTGRSLFSPAQPERTNKGTASGPVAGETTPVKVPAPPGSPDSARKQSPDVPNEIPSSRHRDASQSRRPRRPSGQECPRSARKAAQWSADIPVRPNELSA